MVEVHAAADHLAIAVSYIPQLLAGPGRVVLQYPDQHSTQRVDSDDCVTWYVDELDHLILGALFERVGDVIRVGNRMGSGQRRISRGQELVGNRVVDGEGSANRGHRPGHRGELIGSLIPGVAVTTLDGSDIGPEAPDGAWPRYRPTWGELEHE